MKAGTYGRGKRQFGENFFRSLFRRDMGRNHNRKGLRTDPVCRKRRRKCDKAIQDHGKSFRGTAQNQAGKARDICSAES